jgi:serine/threonine protein phosphatase PrpC
MARISPSAIMCYTMVADDMTGIWRGRVGGHSLVSERKENQDRLIFVVNPNERFVPDQPETLEDNSILTIGVLDGHGRHGSWVPETVIQSFTQSLLAETEPPDPILGDALASGEESDTEKPAPDKSLNESTPASGGGAEAKTEAGGAAEGAQGAEEQADGGSGGNHGNATEAEGTKTDPATANMDRVELQHKLMFNRAHKAIKSQSESGTAKNGRYSGTTATLLSITPHTITIANVGDTEAVIGRIGTNSENQPTLQAHEITTSHRPDLDDERERVEAAGGVVEAQRNRDGSQGTGPIRIWLKDVRTPGLMVSRSLGDVVAHEKLGLIADPWVLSQPYNPDTDLNVIVASDGVWDVVGFDEAVRFLDLHESPSEAARNLAMLAVSRQRPRHHDNVSYTFNAGR